MKKGFLLWALGRFGDRYLKDLRNTLNRFSPIIRSVEDVERLFAGNFPSRRHLWFAVRNLLKYCKLHGWSEEAIDVLMKAMPPTPHSKPENIVPREDKIVELLKALKNAPVRIQVLYHLILDSAIRPLHAVELINAFDPKRLEFLDHGIYRYHAVIERREKHTFIVFISDYTLKLLRSLKQPLYEHTYQHYALRKRLIRAKHVQKFAYNMMRKNRVDRDVADFISGRKPEGIGARHYAELIMLAEEQYPKYAKYLKSLRAKAGIINQKALCSK